MAGPYTGAWRANAVSRGTYTGAAKWGTGVNPVHSIPGSGLRRPAGKLVVDPITTSGGYDATDMIAEDQMWDFSSVNEDPTLPDYDVTRASLWGYNEETGTSNRPGVSDTEDSDKYSNEVAWGLPNPPYDPTPLVGDPRAVTQNNVHGENGYPPWGGSRKPRPNGTFIRSLRRGSKMIVSARVLPNEDVAQGWTNKTHGIAADSSPSDDAQIFMQTSATQRYKVRAGSQRDGSQSTFAAPIESRVTGQKIKNYTREDSARHWDMLPYDQQDYVRPFLSRQAGTGYPHWMLVNENYVSPALQREPPADPSLGPVAGSNTGDAAATETPDYGYSYEDSGSYY